MAKFDDKSFFTGQYWVTRYGTGGDSGFGSHDEHSIKFKGDYINEFIKKFNVETLFDYGCGDGNQLKMINGFTHYTGYDIAPNIIEDCKILYVGHEDKFFTSKLDDIIGKKFDLAISMDVTYHIIEDELFKFYLDTLFSSADVIILFTTNSDHHTPLKHHKPRKIIDHIKDTYIDFELIDVKMFNDNVGFYTYQKKE